MAEPIRWGDGRRLCASSLAAALRFPVATLGIGLMMLGALLPAHLGRGGPDDQLVPWLAISGTALTLAGALAGLVAEARRWKRWLGAAVAIGLALAIIGHGLIFPSFDARAVLIAGLVVALFAVPSLANGHDSDRGCAYGRHLLDSIVFAFVVAQVIWGGLLLLLAILAGLLQLVVSPYVWVDTTVLAFVAVLPLVVFARVENPAEFVRAPCLEPWLSRFTIWLCVPLAIAYLALLEIYVARVSLTWELTTASVAGHVMGIVFLGVIAHLLAYPLRTTGPRWLSLYHRWFYPALVPILLVLALSAWQQIEAGGITQQRYLCCLLLLWLAILTAFSLRERWWRPVLAPALLALLLVVAGAGPWNPLDAALASQAARLEGLLDRAGMAAEGRLVEPQASGVEIDPATAAEAQTIVRFLIAHNDHARIATLWSDPPDWSHQRASRRERRDLERRILADLGLSVDPPEDTLAFFHNPDGQSFDVTGFERGATLTLARQRAPEPALLATSAGTFTLVFDPDRQELRIEAPDGIRFDFRFEALARRLAADGHAAAFTIDQAHERHRVRLRIGILDGHWRAGDAGFELNRLDAIILVE